MGGENISKLLLVSFEDEEDEMINSVLTALETGRKRYQIEEICKSSRLGLN